MLASLLSSDKAGQEVQVIARAGDLGYTESGRGQQRERLTDHKNDRNQYSFGLKSEWFVEEADGCHVNLDSGAMRNVFNWETSFGSPLLER